MVKASDHPRSYNDDGSSDSDHDAYLERMIAEGEDKDSEDGIVTIMNSVSQLCMAVTESPIFSGFSDSNIRIIAD